MDFQTVTRKQQKYTITLNINGINKEVCKKWIDNKCDNKNCTFFNTDIKICQFFIMGTCKFNNNCMLLHCDELKPVQFQHLVQNNDLKPHRGCVVITVNNQKINVCERWVKSCGLPRDKKDEINCNNVHPRNHNIFQHLRTPICELYLKGSCMRGNTCYYLHPPELKIENNIPTPVCSALCVQHVLYINKSSNAMCPYKNCRYAHNPTQITVIKYISDFDNSMKPNQPKINIQKIFEKVYNCIKNNIEIINNYRNQKSLPYIKCPDPVPKNFMDIINLWLEAASVATVAIFLNRAPILFDAVILAVAYAHTF